MFSDNPDDAETYKVIKKYISDIERLRSVSQKVKIATNLFEYLISNQNSINLLKNNSKFYNTVLHKFSELLYSYVDEGKYSEIYKKLIDIGEVKILSYNDSGQLINKLEL